MIAREFLGTAQVPGGEELRLFAHGRDFMIVMGQNELMSTRMRHSEEQLATMTLERLAAPAPRVIEPMQVGLGGEEDHATIVPNRRNAAALFRLIPARFCTASRAPGRTRTVRLGTGK